MNDLNRATVIGNLGGDPELRHTQSGTSVVNMSLATNATWKDKNTGEQQKKTEWHKLTAWGKLADICAQYLSQGSKIYAEGRLQTNKWQDQSGNDRYTTEIVVENMQMLDGKGGGQSGPGQKDAQQQGGQNQQGQNGNDDFEDSIPF